MTGKSKKAKAPALNVPQTDDEANALINAHRIATEVLAQLESEMNAELARVKAQFETLAEPHKTDQSAFFERLQAWAEANRARLTEEGKVKSRDLPAGRIGWRTRPPSVRLTIKTEIILDYLKRVRLKRFVRTKHEIDKEALLKEPEKAVTVPGVKIVSDVEDFYVEPFAAELAEPV